MKTLMLSAFTLFNLTWLAQAQVENDPIMRESLSRQGVPAPSSSSPEPATEQANSQQQQTENLASSEDVADLRAQVRGLQRQVQKLERLHRQQQESATKSRSPEDERPVVSKVQVQNGLRGAQEKGMIGRFSIAQGNALARSFTQEQTTINRQVPALQVCATMADLNQLDEEDLVFMGFERPVAKEIIEARSLLGGFTSSKQLLAIQGVEDSQFEAIQDSIIAIEDQRLAE